MFFAIKYSLHFNKLERLLTKANIHFICVLNMITQRFFFFNEQKEMKKTIHVGPLHSQLF